MTGDIDTRTRRSGGIITVRIRLSDEHGLIEVRRTLDLSKVRKPGVRYDAVRSEPEKYLVDEARAELELRWAKREAQAGRADREPMRTAEKKLAVAIVRTGRDTERAS